MSNIYPRIPLGDCVQRVSTCNPTVSFKDSLFSYIDIASVDRSTKTITEATKILGSDAPSRARQIVHSGDVLVSTVRPNLNAVAQVEGNNHLAIASTGFCVLRPKPGILNSRFLLHWVKSEQFINDMVAKATGASYPAISDKIIKSSLIPLPTWSEQERIADTLDTADALHHKDQELLRKYDELAQSIFYNMFGDPAHNEKGWDLMNLEDVSTKITDGEHGTVQRLEKGKMYIMARNIRDQYIDLSELSFISETDHTRIYKRCNPEEGDLLLVCVGATIGRVAVVPSMEQFSLARSVALIKPDRKKILPNFLLSLFKTDFLQKQIQKSGNSSAQAGLYTGKICQLKVVVPPLALQQDFEEASKKLLMMKEIGKESLVASHAVFHSFQQKAFAG